MNTRSAVERFVSVLFVVSLLLTPLASAVSAQEGATASASNLPASAPAQEYEQPAAEPIQGSRLAQQIREGRWPSQTASSTGNVQPSRYGPQRHNPEDGIPRYAYSPFDERNNREYPCPPGGCTFEADMLLIKLTPEVNLLQWVPPGSARKGEIVAVIYVVLLRKRTIMETIYGNSRTSRRSSILAIAAPSTLSSSCSPDSLLTACSSKSLRCTYMTILC